MKILFTSSRASPPVSKFIKKILVSVAREQRAGQARVRQDSIQEHGQRVNRGHRGCGEGEVGSECFLVTEFQFGMMKNFRRWLAVTVAQ